MEEPELLSDVVVVGAGNAALTAALAAAEAGAHVLVFEKASAAERGGNSRFTGGIVRFVYDGLDDIVPLVPDLSDDETARLDVQPYSAQAYTEDIMRMSEGKADLDLTRVLVDNSYPTLRWMQTLGVRAQTPEDVMDIQAGAVVLACGGFEASPERRMRHLGAEWQQVSVSGTRHNTGELLERVEALGSKIGRHLHGAHAVPVDASSPEVGDLHLGDLTACLSYPLGIMVNRDAQVAAPTHGAEQTGCATLLADGLAQCENPDMQRRIPDKLPRPHLLKQFVFGHYPVAVCQQIGQDFAFLGP